MTNIEKLHLVKEGDPKIKKTIQENWSEIETLLADKSNLLGQGRTAEVCSCGPNKELCVKIYKKAEQIIGVDFYLSPDKEASFMDDLRKLGTKVRVPEVIATFDGGSDGDSFLVMETLPAVSVDDVLQGRAELPSNFNLAVFRDDLVDFVKAMHEAGVYHRDLHEGNVMIDRETAQAYVIDFGAANEFRGHIEPGERGPYHITKDGRDIILTSDEAMVRSVVRKLALNLTKTN